MRKLLRSCVALAAVLLSGYTAHGQTYLITASASNAGNPGGVRTLSDASTSGGTSIWTGPQSTQSWSAAQALPFAFDFYGTPVTHFIVTGNGLLSFDTTTAGAAVNTALNTSSALPNANLPDQTVAFYWDDFYGVTSASDDVYMIVEGSAPNRQLWILNYSMQRYGTSGYAYWAMVLEETSNKIYAIDMNYKYVPSGYTMSATVGVQVNSTTAYQTSASPNEQFGTGGSSNTDNEFYEFAYYPAGAVFPPTGTVVDSVGTNDAYISYDLGLSSAGQIQFGLSGFAIGTGTTVACSGISHHLTSLQNSTNYEFYIRADSTGTYSNWVGPYGFVTNCATITTYPFNESFDGVAWAPTTTYHQCWSISQPSSYRWQVATGQTGSSDTGPSSDASGSGQYVYLEASNGGGDALMQLPELDMTTLTVPELTFKYHMYGSTMSDLFIEGSLDSGATWIKLDSLIGEKQTSINDPWIERVVNLLPVKSNYTLLRFRGSRGSNYYGDASVDDVSVHEAPPCPTPSAFGAWNITATTAEVKFFSLGGTNTVEWGLIGFAQGTGTQVVSTNDTVSLTALPPGSCIDIYIQSNCSSSGNGLSNVAGPFTICTPCLPANLPNYQDFNGWPMSCENPSAGDVPWIEYSNDWAYANYRSNNEADFIMTMRDVNISVDARVKFTWSHQYNSTYPYDDLAFLARPVGQSTWDTIFYASNTLGNFNSNDGAVYNAPGTGVDEIILLPSTYTGQQVQFMFKGHSDYGAGVFLNNYVVEAVPSCLEPISFNMVMLSDTSAAITFVADSTATTSTTEYGPVGFTLGSGMTASGTGDSVYLSGLNPSTQYDIYVSVDCPGNGTSVSSAVYSFRTDCPVAFAAPYTENFTLTSYGPADASLSFENCWTTTSNSSLRWETEDAEGVNENSSSTGPHFDNTTPSTAGGGYVYLETTNTGTPQSMISPRIEMSALTRPTLEFYYFMYGATTGTLQVDVNDGTRWVENVWSITGQQQTAGTDPWVKVEVPLSAFIGDTIQVRFTGDRTGSTGDISLDDISVLEGSSCSGVAGGYASGVTSSSAVLNWSGYSTSDYSVEVGQCGFTPGTGTTVSNANTGYVATSLLPNTCYDFYVTNNCDTAAVAYGPYNFTTECVAQLNGTYTVGGTPGPNNFATLDSAIAALECGLSGPVTYTIVGTHTVQSTVNLGSIRGTSNTNTFTIDGTGGGQIVSPSSSPVIGLENTKHINISNLTITDSSTNGWGIRLLSAVDSVNIVGNTINVSTTTTSSSSAGIAITNSSGSTGSAGSDCNYINIEGNTINGGYYGISAVGVNTTSHSEGLTIRNNTLMDVYYYAIRVNYYDHVVVEGNVSNLLRNASYSYGAYLYYVADVDVIANKFEARSYGVYGYSLNRYDNADSTSIVNNMVVHVGTATYAGIYVTGSSQNIDVYHNTVSATGYGFRDGGSTNMDVRNNIFVSDELPIYFSSWPAATDVLDYNLLYNPTGGNVARVDSVFADLTTLQSADANFNQNSISADPLFVNPTGDLHLAGAPANDVGDNSVGVTVDIDGDTRPASGATVVDMGADEYTPLLWDAEMVEIYEPSGSGCGDSAVVVSVVVRNLGLNDITSVAIYADVTGGVTTSLSTTYTNTIASTGLDTIVVGTVNTYNGANINVDAYLVLANDGDVSNDTANTVSASYISYEPQALPGDTACEGSTVELYAVPQVGVIHGWYANQADTVPLANGDTLSVTADTAQTTYWLGYTSSGSDSVETMFAGGNSCSGGNMFDITAYKTLLIDGFVVNTTNSAGTNMNVIVHYISGSYVGNETNGTAWTTHETVSTVSAGSGGKTRAIFQNPLVLMPGSYGIFVEFAASYTNGSMTITNSDFELTLGAGLCGSFSGVNPGRQFNGRILYTAGNACSPTKIPVSFTVNPLPTASFTSSYVNGNGTGLYTFDATGSTSSDDYTWDFGNGATASGDTVHNVYTANGTYTVTLYVSNDCGTDSITETVLVEGIGLNELSGVQNIRLFPNPSAGNVNLNIEMAKAQNMTIEIVNLQGQVLYTEALGRVEGEYMWSSDLTDLPRGAYFVRLTGDTGVKTIPLSLQ